MIGIIGAMELEIALLKEAISNCKETKIGKFTFYEGILEGKAVVVLLSGIGKVSAAVGTTLLIERYHPKLIVNTGTAGGLADTLVHDIILATEVCYHDVDVTAFGYKIGQQAQMPPAFKADELYSGLIKEVAEKHRYTMHYGQVVSGDSFISDPNRLQQIANTFPHAKAVEMEAAALYMEAARSRKNALAILTISDNIITGEELSSDERQTGFGKMMELALELA